MQTFQNQFEKDEDIEHFQQEVPQREELMVLADLVPEYFVTRHKTQQTDDSDYDWQSDKLKYQENQIMEMSSWLKTSKNLLNPAVVMSQESNDITTFSDEQNCTCDIVKNHSEQAFPKDLLLLIIIGVAGTGKSYLINAIRSIFQSSCAVNATTGKASYNIHGCTIHSLLKRPVGRKGNKDLSGKSLVRLQNNLKT